MTPSEFRQRHDKTIIIRRPLVIQHKTGLEMIFSDAADGESTLLMLEEAGIKYQIQGDTCAWIDPYQFFDTCELATFISSNIPASAGQVTNLRQ